MNKLAAVAQIIGLILVVIGFGVWFGLVGALIAGGAGLFAIGVAIESGV